VEEQNKMLKARRSNNALNVSKLLSYMPEVKFKTIKQSIEEMLIENKAKV
jgi:hypothetical protein